MSGMHPSHDSEAVLTARALSHDPVAMRALVELLRPVIARRVQRVLRSFQAVSSLEAEPDDLVQDVFVWLLIADRRVLRAWDGSKGLSLLNFVGLVCERYVRAKLRTRRAQRAELDPELLPALGARDPEAEVAAARLLDQLLVSLGSRLSPLGRELLRVLYLEEHSVERASQALAMSEEAVYAWKSRLRRLFHALIQRLLEHDARRVSGRALFLSDN